MGAETAPKVLPLWPKPVLSKVEGGETERGVIFKARLLSTPIPPFGQRGGWGKQPYVSSTFTWPKLDGNRKPGNKTQAQQQGIRI